VTDSLGKINVTNYNLSYDGYSTPFFFHDNSGATRLVVGCDEGKIYYYTNIDGNLTGEFTPSDSLFALIDSVPFSMQVGWRSSPSLCSHPGTGRMDLVTGNFAGGLNYFSSFQLPSVIPAISSHDQPLMPDVAIFPNPADGKVTIRIAASGQGQYAFTLYTLAGSPLVSGEFRKETTLDTRGFEPGFYLLRFTSASGRVVTRKLLILH
jgi:hypothetical protein